jgi:filamentous hemagglutinin
MMGADLLSKMAAQETLNSAAMAEAGEGGANEQAALALTKKVKGLDAICLANPNCVLLAIANAHNQPGAPSNTGGEGHLLPILRVLSYLIPL